MKPTALTSKSLSLLALALLTEAASAQQTITYFDTQDRTTPIPISSGVNPTTLDLSSGAAIQSGLISDSGAVGDIIKTGSGTITLSALNTYTGVTRISGGSLSVSTLADGGTASGIGQSGSPVSNLILENGGSLIYLGSAVSTDRLFTMTDSSGALDASGTGAVHFTSTGSISMPGSAARTLVLTGTNTGDNTLAATFADSSTGTASNVTKSGVGTWVLSGTNTYTGVTTINGGTLKVSSMANLGAAGNAASNLVIDGGTLVYNGSPTGTNRLFTIGTNGATLQGPSFSNRIIYSGTGTIGLGGSASARTLTLQNWGAVAGMIGDSGTGANVTSVTVTGSGAWALSGLNTYTGVTTIGASGSLQVSHFSNGGVAGSLGQASSATANLVISGGGSIQAQFTGNQSTDRLFTLGAGGGNLTTAFAGTAIAYTGTGSLAMGDAPSARTLTLGGLGTGSLAAIIPDSGTGANITSLTESGNANTNWTLSGANTYTGTTSVNGGTLIVSSLANGGTASNIGAATNAPGKLVINGGILRYTGAATSTDRLFTVGTNGATLNASGTGAVNFTGTGSLTMALTANARTLTLMGTNTDANTLSGIIANSGTGANLTSLTKSNTGTWVLAGTGANTYTGLTSVTSGELDLNKTAGVNAVGGDVTISGGTLKWLADNQVANGANVILSSGTLDLNGHTETVTTFTNSGGTFSTGAGHLIGTGATITWSGGTNTVNDGGLMEDAHIVITGGTNTVEGGATGGVLQLNSGGAGFEITGANLTLNSDDAGAGKLVLKGDVTSHASATTSTISSGLSHTNPGQIDLNGGTRTFTVEDGSATSDLTITAVIANGGLTKSGAGTLTIDGVATYTGETTINAGTLAISDSGDISSSSGVNLTTAGATFDVGNATAPVIQDLTGVAGTSVQLAANILTLGTANSTTFAGVLEDGGIMGAIAKQGSGTLTLTGVNTYVCETFVNEGTLAIGPGGSIATSCEVDIADGATFDISNGGNQTILDLFGYTGGTIKLGANTLTLGTDNDSFSDGTIEGTGGLVKQGEGTLRLDGALTYTGSTRVNEGTVQADSDDRFASASAHTVASGATLDLNGHEETIGSLAGAGNVTLGTGHLTTGGNNTSTTFSGVIGGTGGLTKTGTGTFTITGTNTFGGPTIIAQGTLQLGAADALSTSTAIQLTGGTFGLNGYSPEAFTSALTVAGAGSTLDFGLGHVGGVTVEFGDSSSVPWSSILTLLHFTVGTDALGFTLPDGLTSTQLAQINLDGYTPIGLDSNGFVEFQSAPVPEPTLALILPCGSVLMAFALWRRRSVS